MKTNNKKEFQKIHIGVLCSNCEDFDRFHRDTFHLNCDLLQSNPARKIDHARFTTPDNRIQYHRIIANDKGEMMNSLIGNRFDSFIDLRHPGWFAAKVPSYEVRANLQVSYNQDWKGARTNEDIANADLISTYEQMIKKLNERNNVLRTKLEDTTAKQATAEACKKSLRESMYQAHVCEMNQKFPTSSKPTFKEQIDTIRKQAYVKWQLEKVQELEEEKANHIITYEQARLYVLDEERKAGIYVSDEQIESKIYWLMLLNQLSYPDETQFVDKLALIIKLIKHEILLDKLKDKKVSPVSGSNMSIS